MAWEEIEIKRKFLGFFPDCFLSISGKLELIWFENSLVPYDSSNFRASQKLFKNYSFSPPTLNQYPFDLFVHDVRFIDEPRPQSILTTKLLFFGKAAWMLVVALPLTGSVSLGLSLPF